MTAAEMEALRKSLDFTQADMAKRFGIDTKTYRDIENGNGQVHERYRLASERVALSIAVERGSPFLAPAAVRKEALALARLITEG